MVVLESDGVVVQFNMFALRPRLAGEYEAFLQFPWFKRVIHCHIDLASREQSTASRANATFARLRQIEPSFCGGVEYGIFVAAHVKGLPLTVKHDSNFDAARRCFARRSHDL